MRSASIVVGPLILSCLSGCAGEYRDGVAVEGGGSLRRFEMDSHEGNQSFPDCEAAD